MSEERLKFDTEHKKKGEEPEATHKKEAAVGAAAAGGRFAGAVRRAGGPLRGRGTGHLRDEGGDARGAGPDCRTEGRLRTKRNSDTLAGPRPL